MKSSIISSVFKNQNGAIIVQGMSVCNDDFYVWKLLFNDSFNAVENGSIEPLDLYNDITDFVFSQRLDSIFGDINDNEEVQENINEQYIRKLDKEEITFFSKAVTPEEIIIVLISEEIDEGILEHLTTIPGTNLKARFDKEDTSTKSKRHVHIFRKGKELFSVNFDGTAHHRENKNKPIPNSVADYLREKKGYKIRKDNVLTMITIDSNNKYYVKTYKLKKNKEEYLVDNN